jgi:hypothetical protein
MHQCNNCQYSFDGKYCNNCGQKASVGRLHLHDLCHESLHAFTHADKGIFKLLKDLLVRPGDAYRKYFSGHRASYFNPVLFFLLTAGFSIFLGDKIFAYEDAVNKMNNEFGKFVLDNTKLIGLLLLPVQASITWAFFFRRFSLVECTVFWLFANGFVFVFKIIATPVYFALIHHKSTTDFIVNRLVFLIMLWQLLALFGSRPKWYSWPACFLIINLVILAYQYAAAYFLGDVATFYTNPWQLLKNGYGF